MAHQEPNTANIPREFNTVDDSVKLLGKELRQLWIAPKKRLLVGVDAESIQLRIFAHYVNDPEFIDALVRGSKHDKSDPHSFNQRVLGRVCKTRQASKRFLYALLLGAGIDKLAEILGATREQTQEALDRLLGRLEGFKRMREEVFPRDAKRGYFIGLDGRKVKIPGESNRDRQHLAMSGYLQNGEAIIVKRAALIATARIRSSELIDQTGSWFYVDIVHDELQSEVDNDMRCAIKVAEIKAQAIVEAGEYYKLNCPMAGSYFNDDHKDYTIGRNWYQTH
jgi:DNA polymerase-1